MRRTLRSVIAVGSLLILMIVGATSASAGEPIPADGAGSLAPRIAQAALPRFTAAAGSFTFISVFTGDINGAPKKAFQAGERVIYYGLFDNSTGTKVTAYFVWKIGGPCGTVTLWSGNLATPPGSMYWYLSTYTPSGCPGSYTYTLSVTYNGSTTAKGSAFTVSGIAGISRTVKSGFTIFKIDRQSANLSFAMVMAKDSTNVNQSPSPRELVSAMVARTPYAALNPVLAFNADYFAPNGSHGPEGLTVRKGVRFDGFGANPDDTDGNEWRRSSFSITGTKYFRVGKETVCTGSCVNWVPNVNTFYNTVGGGPLFLDAGVRMGGTGSTKPCSNESLNKYYCTGAFKWTSVGVSRDGRYLFVVISNTAKTMDQAAAVLKAEGAWRAMKLDGGSSTQAWFKPLGNLVASPRPIANAIMIFSRKY